MSKIGLITRSLSEILHFSNISFGKKKYYKLLVPKPVNIYILSCDHNVFHNLETSSYKDREHHYIPQTGNLLAAL